MITAPGEARTHGLQIMRLTRCLLRYGGLVNYQVCLQNNICMHIYLNFLRAIDPTTKRMIFTGYKKEAHNYI